MRKFIFFIVLFLVFFEATSQTWQKGKIQLMNGLSYAGDVHYYPKRGIVVYRDMQHTRAFATSQIKNFSYFDEVLRLQRSFATYYLKNQKYFFEQVILGNYHLLKKPNHNYQQQDNTCAWEFYDKVNDYFLWTGKKMTPIRQFKKQFEDLFSRHGIDLVSYAKEKNLTTHLPKDQIKLIYQLNIAIERQRILTSNTE